MYVMIFYLIPVVTLVIFLKDTEWDGPTHLWEMFEDTEKQILSFIPDYRINLLASIGIPPEDFRKFKTDVGLLLEYIKNQKEKEKLSDVVHGDKRFRSMDAETASLINTITGSRLTIDEKEEKVDMCKAIDDMRRESMEEGIEKGIESTCLKNIRSIMVGLKYTAEQAMNLLQIPAADRQKYLAKL